MSVDQPRKRSSIGFLDMQVRALAESCSTGSPKPWTTYLTVRGPTPKNRTFPYNGTGICSQLFPKRGTGTAKRRRCKEES